MKTIRAPLAIGLLALVGSVIYAAIDLRRAMFAWTAACGLGVATTLAAMMLVFTLELAGARWWLLIRRAFVSCAATVPVFVAFFIPIAATLHVIYPWASGHETHEHARMWHGRTFFLARAAFYLVTWSVLAALLRRFDDRRVRTLAAVGLPVIGFTLTFASFDWLMSAEPGWVSTIYGLAMLGAGGTCALGVVAVATHLLRAEDPRIHSDHVHAVGRLMLMAILVDGYLQFFQLLLIWIADVPREITFFVTRSKGGWAAIDVVLVLGKFLLPFLALLSRRLKTSGKQLAMVGAWLVVMSALEVAWMVIPASGGMPSFADVLPFVAVIALASAYGMRLAEPRAVATTSAPGLRESLRYRSP